MLVAAAFAVVERNGADSLSATAVSLAVGASNAASYSHFRDGATELLAAVAARGFDQLAATLGDSPSASQEEERIRQIFLRYVRFGLEHPHLYRAMYSSRLATKLGAVNVATRGTARGARTYEELVTAKAMTYEAFVGPMQALSPAPAAQSAHHQDAAKAVATLAHGLVLELIDEGVDVGTPTTDLRMTERLAMASRLIEMLLQGVLTNPRRAENQ